MDSNDKHVERVGTSSLNVRQCALHSGTGKQKAAPVLCSALVHISANS